MVVRRRNERSCLGDEASGAENEPVPSEARDAGPFFHGTKAGLQPEDLLEPGFGSKFRRVIEANYVFRSIGVVILVLVRVPAPRRPAGDLQDGRSSYRSPK